jgi:hypothetical protein
MNGRLISLSLATLLLGRCCAATTVVAILDVRSHSVVLATDARRNCGDGTTTKACKIRSFESENCIVALAGRTVGEGFDLYEDATEACRLNGDLRAKADKFLELATPKISHFILYEQLNDPAFVQANLPPLSEICGAVFAGIYKGQPTIFARVLTMQVDGKLGTSQSDSTDLLPGHGAYFFLGASSEAQQYIATHNKWKAKDAVTKADELIQLEIIDRPNQVAAGPISILTMDIGGHIHWVRKGTCGCKTLPSKCP